MKILAIRGENLASIEGAFEIDFEKEPLASAGIFAITGITGSGKSTILDAMCLALYAKTPRFSSAKDGNAKIIDVNNNEIGQNDVRNILRKGCANAYAEVDFVSFDKTIYRARWTVARARNKAQGAIQLDAIYVQNKSTGEIISNKKREALSKIESLIGLNYDQFTRSVLLAQNDFTAFLKAEKNGKAELLEKITGTAIYSEISKEIYERYKKQNEELNAENKLLENIKILDETQVNELTLQQILLEKELNATETLIQNYDKEIEWHNELKKLTEGKTQAEDILKKYTEEKENAEERLQKLQTIKGSITFCMGNVKKE